MCLANPVNRYVEEELDVSQEPHYVMFSCYKQHSLSSTDIHVMVCCRQRYSRLSWNLAPSVWLV